MMTLSNFPSILFKKHKTLCVAIFLIQHSISAQPGFVDQSVRSNIDNVGSNHGISIGDINNDGLQDVYVVVRELGIPNKLYVNRGNVNFEEIGEQAGVNSTGSSTAATWGDINNDGWLDLYLGNTNSPNKLYLNKGDLTFEDITISAGVGNTYDPRSVQFVDVDNDGFLDIYLHNYNTENVLYKNNHDNTFLDVTTTSGALNIDPAMGTIFFDMDGDGDQDLFALNDGASNALFENNGQGVFEDISEGSGLNFFCFCMGVDYADYDLDGDYDLYISNYGQNFLMENNGDGTFSDKAAELELDDNGMGWGTFWLDYDNDGDQDIYLANHQFISSRPNMLFRNDGGLSFEAVSTDTSLESLYASFGTATADINNDGYLDIIVANWGTNATNKLFVNNNRDNNAILIKAHGTISNRSAIGTTITIKSAGSVQMDQITGATGYASQNSLVLHFGLGKEQLVDELMIKWPSGLVETYESLPVNQYYTATESEGLQPADFSSFGLLNASDQVSNSYNYPNPFESRTFIQFPENIDDIADVIIYSTEGHMVKTLKDLSRKHGRSGMYWDGTDQSGMKVAGGFYFYIISSSFGDDLAAGRMMLIR